MNERFTGETYKYQLHDVVYSSHIQSCIYFSDFLLALRLQDCKSQCCPPLVDWLMPAVEKTKTCPTHNAVQWCALISTGWFYAAALDVTERRCDVSWNEYERSERISRMTLLYVELQPRATSDLNVTSHPMNEVAIPRRVRFLPLVVLQ